MAPKQVIIFNGPPGSGKDYICNYLSNVLDRTRHSEFKEHLFRCTCVLFNVTYEEFMELYTDREKKETSTCLLYGYSPREAMIYVSEEVIKPKFGKDYFGLCTAENLGFGLTVFSDGGFIEELEAVYDECDGNMMIVQLHRDGCDFSKDSRSYINDFKDVPIVKIFNNSDISNFELAVLERVSEWLETIA